jgi:hypothetical protein
MIEALETLAYRLERPHSSHVDEAAAKHLREAAAAIAGLRESNDRWAEINSEQNTRVAALEAENARLRGALEKIANTPAWGAPHTWEQTPAELRMFAREALAPAPAPEVGK